MNKVILIGRLARDPELRYISGSNVAVCTTSIAVDRRFKAENQPTADFIPIVAWRQTAEFISKYFTKGSRIAVTGQIQVRSWDGADGKKNYATEVIVDDVEFVESKRNDGSSYGQGNLVPPPQSGYRAPAQENSQSQTQNASQTQSQSQDSSFSDGYFSIDTDDNVPF